MNQIHKPHYDLGLENNYIVYQVIGDECCIKMRKKYWDFKKEISIFLF
jgi:hypothetical protein